ncbi:MAG: hypothetical protein ABI601_12440 [bacterium]
MHPLQIRKRAELELKLNGLADEFTEWKQRTAAKAPLEKHNSQVARLTRQLERARAKLVEQISDTSFDILDEARTTEADVLAVYRIWDFFRSKLSQRDSDGLRKFLIAADDLAWACYAPMCNAKVSAFPAWRPRVKEPPLSFLNGGASPFAQVRNVAFQIEDTLDDGLDLEKFGQLVQKLPIPVVGIPWHELSHLPEILVVGHEIGHAVEFDLALTKDLQQALTDIGLDANRLLAWQAWRSEVFADVFGAIACGPAFVGTLLDFLAEPKLSVISESRSAPDWGDYPTVALRVRIVIEAIRLAGHTAEADGRAAEWTTLYGEKHAMQAFDGDVAHVVEAFAMTTLEGLGGATIHSLVGFDTGMHERAVLAADELLAPGNPGTKDAREVLAGVRLAFERAPAALAPVERGGKGVVLRALTFLESARGAGVRSSLVVEEEAEKQQTQYDADAGDEWLKVLQKRE